MLKTVLCWDAMGEDLITWFIVDGDWTRFQDVYVNGDNSPLADELCDLMYDSKGELNFASCTKDDAVKAIISGAKLVVCGIVP